MEKIRENAQKLLDYLYESPTAFHATNNAAKQLVATGFKELHEADAWDISPGGKYFVRKNSSSFAAFIAGTSDIISHGIRAVAAHTDSPCFVIKPSPQISAKGHIKLNTAPYGGPIMHTWFDRPLSLAGRVLLKSADPFNPTETLININRPLMVIPSLAIHLNREVNQGFKINAQSDTLPFAALASDKLEKDDYLMNLLTKELDCAAEDMLDFDLSLYEYESGRFVGQNDEFISSSRLDDLWMVHAGLCSIVNSAPSAHTKLLYCPDNEETGSLTPHGAQSIFLQGLIERIVPRGTFGQAMANSFFMSADLAHATNPNYPEKDDPTNVTILGGGPVLKYSASQKYATTGYTAGIFAALCQKADIPMQKYITRSDVVGGGTIGAIMAANLGVRVVDMGMPVLGMHSIREYAATIDNEYVLKLFDTFMD